MCVCIIMQKNNNNIVCNIVFSFLRKSCHLYIFILYLLYSIHYYILDFYLHKSVYF